MNCNHDQGGEFIGYEFKEMLEEHSITDRPTTAENPQANSVCERMHQTSGNSLRVLSTMNPPRGSRSAKDLVDTVIASDTENIGRTIVRLLH
jgi:transposase InsO family protein